LVLVLILALVSPFKGVYALAMKSKEAFHYGREDTGKFLINTRLSGDVHSSQNLLEYVYSYLK